MDTPRKPPQTAPPRGSKNTEYQERFLHPCCQTVCGAQAQEGNLPPTRPRSHNGNTFRSSYGATNCNGNQAYDPQPAMSPRCHGRNSSNPQNLQPNEEDDDDDEVDPMEQFTSVYQQDFRAWKSKKLQPIKFIDNLKVRKGLVVPLNASKNRQNQIQAQFKSQQQSEGGSNREDYHNQPVQPKARRERPVQRQVNGPAEVQDLTWSLHQEVADRATKLIQNFEDWSLETKFHGQLPSQGSGEPTIYNFLLTTCKRNKPEQLSVQGPDQNKPYPEPAQDHRAGSRPRHYSSLHKEVY